MLIKLEIIKDKINRFFIFTLKAFLPGTNADVNIIMADKNIKSEKVPNNVIILFSPNHIFQ